MQAADVLSGVRRLERGLRLAARAAERATGLTAAQLFVLEELAASESSSLSDLASRTHTDRSSVSAVIDKLAAAGLVKRSPSPDDRRRMESQITRRGRAVLRRAPLSPTQGLVRAVGRLSATRVHQLATALAALNDELGYTQESMLFEEERK